jgi:hypothetical protein
MAPVSANRGVRTRPRTKPTAEVNSSAVVPTDDQIRQRAFEIYVSRGATPGNPEWDWQQAELELRARIALLGKA